MLSVGIFSAAIASAQRAQLNQETKNICRDVMRNIFQDIVKVKGQFKELENFGEDALAENQYGLPLIQYRCNNPDSLKEAPCAFGLTIVRVEDANFNEYGFDAFNLVFPLLDLKFAGYYQKNFLKTNQFDLQKIVQKNGQILWDYQQKFMPYKLSLKTVKETYGVGENIDFVVTLTNLTKRNIVVKDLNEETLYFLYDNKMWGAKEVNSTQSQSIKEIILKPDESISKTFSGYGFSNPKDFEIYCSYVLTYKGVKPAASLIVKVVE